MLTLPSKALSFWAPPALRMLHLQEEFLLYPTFKIDGSCPLLEFIISPGLLTPHQALSCLHQSSATRLACFLGSILLIQPTNIYQVQTMCQVLFETLGSDADQSQSRTCRRVSLTFTSVLPQGKLCVARVYGCYICPKSV